MLNKVKSRKAGNKLAILSSVLLSLIIISCGFPGGSIRIKHSESGNIYQMTANFNPDRTAAVDKWLNKELASGDMSFANIEMDGDITLDNKATFYLKKISRLSSYKDGQREKFSSELSKGKGCL